MALLGDGIHLDDDYPQYSLIDGSRAFTGVVGGVVPTLPAHLATKGYIDGAVTTDHGVLGGLADDDHTQYLKERVSGGVGTEVPMHTHTAVQGGELPDVTHVQATTAAGQSIPTSAWTTIIFDTEVYDTLGEYDPMTGMFTAAVAGYYHVHASICFTATTTWAATEYAILSAWVDGVEKLRLDRAYDHTDANIQVFVGGGASFYLAVGQALAIRVYQASGDALALYPGASWNWLTIDRLR